MVYLEYLLSSAETQESRKGSIIDTAELVRRLTLLRKAEAYAHSSPCDNHRILALIYWDMMTCARRLGDFQQSSAIALKLIDRFYDVPLCAGDSAYQPALGCLDQLNALFGRASTSNENAVDYFRTLSEEHPIREFRFHALLSLADRFQMMRLAANAQEVTAAIDSEYPDLLLKIKAQAGGCGCGCGGSGAMRPSSCGYCAQCDSVSPTAGGNSVVDPVCGMTLTKTAGSPNDVYKGKTYYFCSQKCLDLFKQNPAKYVK
jgi:Cu+-exporting ATPase